jgi:hypothetical protein
MDRRFCAAVARTWLDRRPQCRETAGVLLKDKARRMAVNFARLPELLGKPDPQ